MRGADTTRVSLNAGTGAGSHQCRRRQRQDTLVSPKPAQEAAVVADSNLLGLVNVGVAAEAHRYLLAILIPADGYDPQTANGVSSHGFGIQRNGSATFNSSVAGHYVLTTVPRLEIRGATPF